MKTIYVKSKLTHESPPGTANVRAHFPKNEVFDVSSNSKILFNVSDGKFQLEITSSFETPISPKRYAAFEEALKTKSLINILAPENTKIAAFVKENIGAWSDPGRKIFGLIRWVYNSFLPDAGTHMAYSWSLDNILFHDFSTVEKERNTNEWIVFRVNPNLFRQISNDEKLYEPEYFKTLREAEYNLEEHPKSALILMTVALEMALKQFLVGKDSSLDKLFNGDSPPSLEFIFMKILVDKESRLTFNDSSYEIFKNLVKNRNDLVHKGFFNLSKESLLSRFRFVSDVLYILDSFRGFSFNQSFFEFEPRLLADHKKDYDPLNNVGQLAFASKTRLSFRKRYWRDY